MIAVEGALQNSETPPMSALLPGRGSRSPKKGNALARASARPVRTRGLTGTGVRAAATNSDRKANRYTFRNWAGRRDVRFFPGSRPGHVHLLVASPVNRGSRQ